MRCPLVLCLLAACATTTVNEKPGPRGLRADQHLAIAQREDLRATEMTRWPDTRPGADGRIVAPAPGSWYGTWDTAEDHRRLAQIHRSAAAYIEAQYEDACREIPSELIATSPLQRHGLGTGPLPNGVLVLLSPEAGPPDKLLARMRCHLAWMMLGRSPMDDCPLDLPGIQISAHGHADAIELTITVSDPALVPELRRRAAHDVEAVHPRPVVEE